MVRGSVPCTREKLLGTDSCALEIPILASNGNSNELIATTVTTTKDEHRGRGQRLNVGAANDRHSLLPGGLNTGSARAVRFEPLSVMQGWWSTRGHTATVRTSTASKKQN